VNGKVELNKILGNRKPDRLSWTVLADTVSLSIMPDSIRKLNPLEFYKHIGCDIVQFGNYGVDQLDFAVKPPYSLVNNSIETMIEVMENDVIETRLISPWGELVSRSRKLHPVKYLVETINDLKIYKKICMEVQYIIDETGCAESYQKMDRAIADDGVFIPITQESPVQMLLEFIMGTQTFYYLYSDYPDEIEDLLDIMHESRKEEYRIIAKLMPYRTCIPVENTSTTYISPQFYRKFSVPQLRDYISILHAGGKKCILHMCGHVKDLLPDIRETGLDGVHALTPAPVGNTDYELALDVLGEDIIIMGCLAPNVFHKLNLTKQELWNYLDIIYTPRLRESNFVLVAAADGIPTEIERFYYIQEWMEKNGERMRSE
jgi:hypothetical protein